MPEPLPSDLEQMIVSLREPVAVDGTVRERVLQAARRHGVPRPRALPGRWLVLAPALAALIALVFVLPTRHEATVPRLTPFVLTAPHAVRVAVVGDFNDWDPHATPLERLGADAWGVMVPLRPGRYRYSFVLDGSRWIADPAAPQSSDDDFGPRSSVLTILPRGT